MSARPRIRARVLWTVLLAGAMGCTVDFQAGTNNNDGGIDPLCGNATLDPGEACDDGNNVDGDDCRRDCGQDFTACGDGAPDQGETCDDGNNDDGDGCDALCQVEFCDETVCPLGCCTADGHCLAGTAADNCGTGSAACLDCNLSGQVCEAQACQDLGSCDPNETRPCDNCGERTCTSEGQWGPCESQGECSPGTLDNGAACGNCGTLQRTCDQTCVWGAFACTGEGVCNPGAQEDGAACGDCGTQQRTCDQTCAWGAFACADQGVCTPGTQDIGSSCGNCGYQERDCQNGCSWSSWTCVSQGLCSPGAEQWGAACGMCGTEYRDCEGDCYWHGWDCVGEGVCNHLDVDYGAACGNCGTQERVCSHLCTWNGWSCEGQGVCAAGSSENRSCYVAGEWGFEYRFCSTTTCTWGSWGPCIF